MSTILALIEGMDSSIAEMSAGCKSLIGQDPLGRSEVEETILNFLPSYREVLTRTQLPIYAGGELILILVKRMGRRRGVGVDVLWSGDCGDALIKGAVLGGLETYFSPIKTRSARKLGKEKELTVMPSLEVVTGPRALRAQKSLARVKR
jgi:hypothetical protein